jgi:DNA-directed RNA polymerase specialized sigma24 family protein
MIDCRSISPETWKHAHAALVLYFRHRCGFRDAEDQAQETMTAIWQRQDYQFESEEDFLKVCHGFARKIRFEALREAKKHAAGILDPNLPDTGGAGGARSIEAKILLREVRRLGEQQMDEEEWDVIWLHAMQAESGVRPASVDAREANRMRVRLHRFRRKLSELVGWRPE